MAVWLRTVVYLHFGFALADFRLKSLAISTEIQKNGRTSSSGFLMLKKKL
jgi:hypothetical protein